MGGVGPRQGRIEGFTLVELLVVILIVAILAAVAIPSFLSTAAEADDSPAKALARTAQTTAELIGLDNGGSYATVTKAELRAYEPAIATTAAHAQAYLSSASGTSSTFQVTVTAVASGDKFTLTRSAGGIATRACKVPKGASHYGGCEHVKGTSGTW